MKMDRYASTGCSGKPCRSTFPLISYQPFGSATSPGIYECLFCARFGEISQTPPSIPLFAPPVPRLDYYNKTDPSLWQLCSPSSRSLPPGSYLCTTCPHGATRAQHLTMPISLEYGLKLPVAVPHPLSQSECPANVLPTTLAPLSCLLRRKPLCPRVRRLSGEWWNHNRTWKSVSTQRGFHSNRN